MNDQRPTIFGVPFNNCTMTEALSALDGMVARRGCFAAFINAHCLNLASHDAEYRDVLKRADAVWPDGSGVKMAGDMLGIEVPENVNGTDMFPLMCGKPYTVYMLGAAPGVAQTAMEKASVQFPIARFVGADHGYFRDALAEAEAIARINEANPDILLVALGVPRQEKWIAQHRAELRCGVAVAVGGLLDFVSGRIPRAPLWMRRCGIEWMYRLYQEPVRLFKRYVIGNPLFVFRVWCEKRRRGKA